MVSALSAACCTIAAAAGGPSADDAYAFARSLAFAGPRPAASAAERRAHGKVKKRFKAAGLKVAQDSFRVRGHGTSRNVVGILDTPATCLRVVMAHIDSDPPADGADDNASGVAALVAIGDTLPDAAALSCDVWLIATGSEERGHTKLPDHQGALAVVRRLRRLDRMRDLEWGLSIDEVGIGRSFTLRSKARRAKPEELLLAAARGAGVRVNWRRDSPGGGNSDHRELTLAGLTAAKFGVPDDPLRHTAADKAGRVQRGSFDRALQVIWPVVSG